MSLEELFPGLRPGTYLITSPVDEDYNCIAWSVGNTHDWLWPGDPAISVWPAELRREETLTAFQDLFGRYGFETCTTEEFEPGVEKVALFATADSCPTHAARQLPTGRWTSKLGKSEDIEHDLHALAREVYGAVVRVFRRPVVVTPS
jgi:hypothetical protein